MKEDSEGVVIAEEIQLQAKCLLLGRPCCPFPALTLFWKITIGTTAGLMLTFSLTLFLMASAMTRYAAEVKEVRQAMIAGHGDIGTKVEAVGTKVDGHKQLTMDNRVVTSRIEGLLNGIFGKQEHEHKK